MQQGAGSGPNTGRITVRYKSEPSNQINFPNNPDPRIHRPTLGSCSPPARGCSAVVLCHRRSCPLCVISLYPPHCSASSPVHLITIFGRFLSLSVIADAGPIGVHLLSLPHIPANLIKCECASQLSFPSPLEPLPLVNHPFIQVQEGCNVWSRRRLRRQVCP